MIRVELKGYEELQRKLATLSDKVNNRVLQGAVTGAIRQAAKEIRAAAPVGGEYSPKPKGWSSTLRDRYGRLRQNIKVSRVRKAKRSGKGAKITTGNAFWGVFYELGTRNQPARPWFVPAFNRARENMLGDLSRRIKTGVEKQWKSK